MEEYNIGHTVAKQVVAGLRMLRDCIDRCPDAEWNEKHNDYPFSRVVFHTLFDVDLILSDNERDLKSQPFHSNNRVHFGGYEELEGTIAEREYVRIFIESYYDHCLAKVPMVITRITDLQILLPDSDYYGSMTKLERFVNCARHTQHHAAQLGLRLQFLTGKEMDWIGRIDT